MSAAEPGSFLHRLQASLSRLRISDGGTGRVWVALSGGLDSTVLLQALFRLGLDRPLAAVHVDHGLHPDSPDWAARCVDLTTRLGIEFQQRRVALAHGAGQSLEAAAREARYDVFRALLAPGELLLTAHHADDQLETVLLRLLRGSGIRGLTAIHEQAPLGDGRIVRPLLDFSRAELRAQAQEWQLDWLEDPSNSELRFDRNFLRAEILPRLRERWPAAHRVATRLARQMSEAEGLLADLARLDLAAVTDLGRLPIATLRGLSAERQRNALRHAIAVLELPTPSAAQLAELRKALEARSDAEVLVAWPGAELRSYRDHLYLMHPLPQRSPPPVSGAMGSDVVSSEVMGSDAIGSAAIGADAIGSDVISAEQSWSGPEGRLELVPASDYGIPDAWARAGLGLSFRVGGERFRPHLAAHSTSLKHWFQEAAIVPWMRERVPLLYRQRQLVAVADLCLADQLPQADEDAPFWRPVWTGHPPLR